MAKRKAAAIPEEAAEKKPEKLEERTPAAETGDRRAEQKRVMYVGPTIAGFGVQNRVYDRMPEEFGETIEKTPELRNLFIKIEEYPQANRMLREEKGYIFSAYMKALEIKNGGKS